MKKSFKITNSKIISWYVFLSYCTIIFGHYSYNMFFPHWVPVERQITIFNPLLSFIVLIIFIIILIGIYTFLEQKNAKFLLIVIPSILIFLIGNIILWINNIRDERIYEEYLLLVSFFVFIFQIVSYSEKLRKTRYSLELMHKKYLQLFNSFIWMIIFVILGIILWEINVTVYGEMFAKLYKIFLIGIFQIIVIAGLGLLISVYSFVKKLTEIELTIEKLS